MTPIMKSTVSSLFAIALSTAAVAAFAAEKESSGKSGQWPSFEKVDTDKSGSISQDEAKSIQGLSQHFTQFDKNSDGQLSKSEYESAQKAAKKSSSSSSSGSSGSSKSGAEGSPSSGGSSSSGGK